MQDHERAYFDSADWVLGKVRQEQSKNILTPIFRHGIVRSQTVSIAQILPYTAHRLCMWHIMEKVPEKVGPSLRENEGFWERLNKCVWGSENSDEFVSQWNSIMTDYGLMENDWFSSRFNIRESWIQVYFLDIPLAGMLRTTS